MKIPAIKPAALMSYTRSDDEHHSSYLSELGAWVGKEVQAYTGIPFPIFRDKEDIAWGQSWPERINHLGDMPTFFIPILTPSFFASEFCRYELETFLQREQRLGRSDLVLPVYFIRVPALENADLRADDPLAQTLAARQRIDWRKLRFEPFSAPSVRRALEQIAERIAAVIETLPNE
jgi:F-box protein 11